MFAVIRSGGKQHRVQVGEKLKVEKLEAEVGSTIEISDILLIQDGESVKIGQPIVAGAKVVAKVAAQDRSKKVIIFKRRRRKGFHKKRGHRQPYTELEITNIHV